jgi:branched-chain amino acid transport system ATP-binding protein
MPLLEIRSLHTYYGQIHALKGISFVVEKGEIVTLLGSNGAGKSTTLKTISGLVRPRSGEIIFDGKPIHHLRAHEIVKLGIVQVPEGRRVFGTLTVDENLDLGGFVLTSKTEKEILRARVYEHFPRLKERRNQLAGTLSGGEQQMLAIGRAVMTKPRLLMLDEPSMGLAPTLVNLIMEMIRTISQAGITILLVEQNARAALKLAQNGYVLETGVVTLSGTAEELSVNDKVIKAYLGL